MSERCIFLTGASSEIGMAFLEAQGDGYSRIFAHYNHGSDRFDALKERFRERLTPLRADLQNEEEIMALIDAVDDSGVYPDHFIHLASDKMTGGKFHKRDHGDFGKAWQISVYPSVILLNAFLEKMVKKKYGRIIFMLTSCTFGIPPRYYSPYVTTKYALLGLMKALSTEYSAKGITVNGISPEMMDTKFLDGMLKKEVILKENAEKSPLGRNIEVKDVIPVISYLLSDAAEAVTGQNIGITGGME